MMNPKQETPGMLPVQEARQLISSHTSLRTAVNTPLEQTLGRVLATTLYAPVSIPIYEQSAMDGYALQFDGWQQQEHLEIAGEMAAGATSRLSIAPHQAARIFTGAPLPDGADTVVMQEKVRVHGDRLLIEDAELAKGSNVRAVGSEIIEGALALPQGALLTPAAIGYLAGMGIRELPVYPAPRITVIVTGDELQAPGKPLQFGQVYESNSYTLRMALLQMQIHHINFLSVADDFDQLLHIIAQALGNSDMVLLTGGVSVGNYDYVAKALETCGVTPVFHKLKQKPGKPLFFGVRDQQQVFGLPGNPSSVLTCFYEYVYPCIREQMGYGQTNLTTVKLPLLNDYSKKAGLTHYLKGYVNDEGVKVLQAQESYRMHSFAVCNGLIVLPESIETVSEGDLVEVHLLPQ
ncbi:gephyrin-like molybdotransferase Glp [Paraflavitalea sp. CAU 1676]|uniref:molybdopterin molybdotransferase MoeA n=1 Tax=Paraflavitalea sp. CAU 1676 TaxID=3032598 RepID=UPI0023DB2033|nr:gephyrin-like molybdotransferase Glp [Paraflavitalea sp. CAU 1676]MDF2188046.1 molybdopterin molybdotransferase MoeA [Paraflavitalea sp. CAU 1676]